jgi:general secretion pathway protein L
LASPAEAILGPIREAAGRAGITEFLRWWKDELSAAVPAQWRERLASRGMAFVAFEGEEWRALRPVAGRLVDAGRANLGSLDAAGRRSAFRRLVEDISGGTANVWIVLPDASVLVRPAQLPLAAEEALRDAVGFELDRLTPFSREHACYDHRVTGRDAAAQRLTLELAVTARAPLEARLAQLRELGATVLGAGTATDLAAAPTPFNLIAPESRERPATSRTAILARTLAVLAGLLALVALAYPLWQKREAVIDLQPRLDKAKAGADVADRLVKEIEKLAAERNFLVAKKQGQQPAVVLLEDLSRLFPDATWVQQLDLKAGPKVRELQISGETGSSSQLIELLEKSGSLTNASFKSPLTKGVTPGTERFLISAEVKPRPIPEPMPEEALALSQSAGTAVLPGIAAQAGGAPAAAPPIQPPSTPTPAVTPAAPAGTAAVPAPATGTPAPAKPATKG